MQEIVAKCALSFDLGWANFIFTAFKGLSLLWLILDWGYAVILRETHSRFTPYGYWGYVKSLVPDILNLSSLGVFSGS